MQQDYSLTIRGLLVTVLPMISKAFDLDFDEGHITELVESVATVVGLVMIYAGRVRRGDLTWYGKRK